MQKILSFVVFAFIGGATAALVIPFFQLTPRQGLVLTESSMSQPADKR